jgi:hypothetical protein
MTTTDTTTTRTTTKRAGRAAPPHTACNHEGPSGGAGLLRTSSGSRCSPRRRRQLFGAGVYCHTFFSLADDAFAFFQLEQGGPGSLRSGPHPVAVPTCREVDAEGQAAIAKRLEEEGEARDLRARHSYRSLYTEIEQVSQFCVDVPEADELNKLRPMPERSNSSWRATTPQQPPYR